MCKYGHSESEYSINSQGAKVCRLCTNQRAQRSYYANREDRKAAALAYYYTVAKLDNDKFNEQARERRLRNLEQYKATKRVANGRRRSMKREQFVENVDDLLVLELDDGMCGICHNDVDPTNYQIDHIIPLALGGEHSYANTQVAHPKCNQQKGAFV